MLRHPRQVTGLAGTVFGRSIELTWDVATDADSYRVEWHGPHWQFHRTGKCHNSGVASYVMTDLTVSTAYTIRVVSLRQNAPEGAASDSIELTTLANAVVPDQPSAPILTVGDERLDVSWTAPADNGVALTSYDIQYRVEPDGTPLSWNHGGTATSNTITGLTNATLYGVRVRAENREGMGPWSDYATGTPFDVPGMHGTAHRYHRQRVPGWWNGLRRRITEARMLPAMTLSTGWRPHLAVTLPILRGDCIQRYAAQPAQWRPPTRSVSGQKISEGPVRGRNGWLAFPPPCPQGQRAGAHQRRPFIECGLVGVRCRRTPHQ